MRFHPPPLRFDRHGVAAAEFAVIAMLMLILLLSAFDFGLWILQRMQSQSALAVGGVYAQGFPTQTQGIKDAISGALSPLPMTGVVINDPVLSCDCGSADTAGTGAGCGATCPGAMRVYVTLSLTWPFNALHLMTLGDNEVRQVIRVQ